MPNRRVHAYNYIMGNQGKMAGNSKICIGIQRQLILPEFIYLPRSFGKCNLRIKRNNKLNQECIILQDQFLEKPQLFHTFSVILILSNYRKSIGKIKVFKKRIFLALQI